MVIECRTRFACCQTHRGPAIAGLILVVAPLSVVTVQRSFAATTRVDETDASSTVGLTSSTQMANRTAGYLLTADS